jgi:hypothetical protein
MAATIRLARLREDFYRERPFFTMVCRRHLSQKRETVPPEVVLLS